MLRMNKETYIAVPGRPREFDTNQALGLAVRQFSAHGFHGTSICDLNKALGLTTGSIYKAWGDKRGLLLAALEYYIEQQTRAVENVIVGASDGLTKIAAVLRLYAEKSSNSAGESGCLIVEMAAELSVSDAEIALRLRRQEASRRAQFQAWVNEGITDGSIANQTDIESAAEMLMALTLGMRVLGKAGASLERMLSMTGLVISNFSSKNPH